MFEFNDKVRHFIAQAVENRRRSTQRASLEDAIEQERKTGKVRTMAKRFGRLRPQVHQSTSRLTSAQQQSTIEVMTQRINRASSAKQVQKIGKQTWSGSSKALALKRGLSRRPGRPVATPTAGAPRGARPASPVPRAAPAASRGGGQRPPNSYRGAGQQQQQPAWAQASHCVATQRRGSLQL